MKATPKAGTPRPGSTQGSPSKASSRKAEPSATVETPKPAKRPSARPMPSGAPSEPKASRPRISARPPRAATESIEPAALPAVTPTLPEPPRIPAIELVAATVDVPSSGGTVDDARPVVPEPASAEPGSAVRHPPVAARDEAEGTTEGPIDDGEGTILVTGICGRLGKLVARVLHRDSRVVGIDRRPFPDAPKDIVHYRLDVRRKKTKDVFRQERVRAVVHLGVMHNPRSHHRLRHSWNVVAFQKLLEYMEQFEEPKLVVLSSANVYGPQPDNPQFLTEEAPLLGSQEFFAIRDLVELDMLAQSYFWRNPKTETVILRPCHILGTVRNAPSNYLRLERPISVLGFDPMVQVIHERDVVRAILRALEPGVRGIYNLRGPGELPLSRLFAMAGKKLTPVPGPLLQAAIAQAFRFRLSSFPSPELDHVRYVCMVDDTRAREQLGFVPAYTVEEAVQACIDA